ncbi:spirocyclase AveC family protein [Nocardia vulneris]|uniref:Spirocyclase, AveC family n=1 Tax=Nocardia vulneris TaxID=1141657 RepID=A0ABR4ZGR1_9NOCA|nr:spirocyclase AveC family protein [Nocardia vulneris]KIA64340.1 hypothetical protein FG87_13880 [Nocardia vulneris]
MSHKPFLVDDVSSSVARPTTETPPVLLWPRTVWTVLGIAFLALEIVVMARWIADDGYRLEPTTAHNGSLFPVLSSLGVTAICTVIFVVFTTVIVRDAVRQRCVTPEFVMTIGIGTGLWMEQLSGFFKPVFVNNANGPWVISSFAPYLPGWQGNAPHEEPYQPTNVLIWLSAPAVTAFCVYLLSRIRRRYPNLSGIRFVAVVLAFGFVSAELQDPFFAYFGFTRWDTGIEGFTLFPGTWHQFPLHEAMGFGFILMSSLIGFHYWLRGSGRAFLMPGAGPGPRWLRAAVPVVAAIGVVCTIIALYVTWLVALSLVSTVSPTELPAFWSEVSFPSNP